MYHMWPIGRCCKGNLPKKPQLKYLEEIDLLVDLSDNPHTGAVKGEGRQDFQSFTDLKILEKSDSLCFRSLLRSCQTPPPFFPSLIVIFSKLPFENFSCLFNVKIRQERLAFSQKKHISLSFCLFIRFGKSLPQRTKTRTFPFYSTLPCSIFSR